MVFIAVFKHHGKGMHLRDTWYINDLSFPTYNHGTRICIFMSLFFHLQLYGWCRKAMTWIYAIHEIMNKILSPILFLWSWCDTQVRISISLQLWLETISRQAVLEF
jgi:hypothetical protein